VAKFFGKFLAVLKSFSNRAASWIGPAAEPELTPQPTPKPFCRVLEPVSPWLDLSTSNQTLEENFKGRYDTISVSKLTDCTPQFILAGFYGPASYQIPLDPRCFRFTDQEATLAGGAIQQEASNPPWPPEYSNAHHNLIGDQVAITASMVRLFSNDRTRAASVTRFDVFDELCGLLGRPDLHAKFKEKSWKRFRNLLKLKEERETLWVPLAIKHNHLLDDTVTQGEIRKLYNQIPRREEWKFIAENIPRVATDAKFSTGR
jgi:hypothetical protein